MKPNELIREFENEFGRRRFVGGLLPAFIDFFHQFDALGGRYSDLDAFFKDHPRQQQTAAGKTANTLIVRSRLSGGDRTQSLRPLYNHWERYFRAEQKRFDYPNCAPHATQAWNDYLQWIDAILALSPEEATKVRQRVVDHVLATLPSHEVDVEGLQALEQRFSTLLQGFSMSGQKREPAGAVFQGIVYAYIRADAPHLHLDVSKVGAGSKRLQRVGDIDGWEGERLILSAEVKSFDLRKNDVPDLAAFANEVARRKALGIVAAATFQDEARADLEGQNIRTLDLDDLVRVVEFWDPLKQRAALNAFTYYVHHIEKNSPLMRRLERHLQGDAVE